VVIRKLEMIVPPERILPHGLSRSPVQRFDRYQRCAARLALIFLGGRWCIKRARA